jgi:valyl-tRNA synthetase
MEGFGGPDWPSLNLAEARAVAGQLAGLKVNAAREHMIGLLSEAGFLRGESPVTRMVPSAERSGAPLEILVTPQWFVRLLDIKNDLIERGRRSDGFPTICACATSAGWRI